MNFEQDMAREVLRSERRRATILMYLGITIGLTLLVVNLLNDMSLSAAGLGRYLILLTMVFVAFYEFGVRQFQGRLLRLGKPLPNVLRYGNALLEVTIPSFAVIVAVVYTSPVEGLLSPATSFYFLLIILSILRLDFKLCLFTGVCAGLEYLALVIFWQSALPPLSDNNHLFETAIMQTLKCLLMVVGGGLAGMVSQDVRQRFLNSLRLIEDRNRVVLMFGQHVSPEVANRLLAQKADLDSETRFVCLMFLDIRNFTTFSETRSPEEVVNYLNTLFDSMIDSVNAHHGIINKFLGDGFMAVFGAPLSDGQDCRNAVSASFDILAKMEKLNESGQIPPTRIGIGLHAGQAVTGNVGSHLRKEYTIIGDTVNLASRIEQLNKQFGSQLLISETVWQNIEPNQELTKQAEALEPIQVKGRQVPVQIFKLA